MVSREVFFSVLAVISGGGDLAGAIESLRLRNHLSRDFAVKKCWSGWPPESSGGTKLISRLLIISPSSHCWNSDVSILENPSFLIPEDRFRFHSFEEFMANCDSKGDLYDYVGHMRLVNGQILTDHIVLGEVAIAEKGIYVFMFRHMMMKLYLWDNAASEFCQKFKSYGRTPHVLLVTTVNPKHLGGTLCLTSMSSSRVVMDDDVQPSKDYIEWLSSNTGSANRIAAEVVTKPEKVTLEELFSYIKQEASKVAWFECTATIDDVVQGSSWYYVSCGGCNSKAVKGPTSLMCNNKRCEKSEVTGMPQYLTKISVYDKSEQAVFVILASSDFDSGLQAALVQGYVFACAKRREHPTGTKATDTSSEFLFKSKLHVDGVGVIVNVFGLMRLVCDLWTLGLFESETVR
ncbi:hypothetical protein Bca52824_077114 [Brassica carinata]|uniref:Replication factor A C-terminal domain-containing protein n=1 Tax=Brassica carinata TaxID=52824 RepID=A0A8X7TWZ2_BRACI|nr:hypothetical protein Bca52824_077114 [Brassica carinata]